MVAEIAGWAMSAPRRWPQDERPQFWWVTSSYEVKGKAVRDITAHLPKGIVADYSERQAKWVLKNGSQITVRSADGKDSLVSERLHGLVGDECGDWNDGVYDQQLSAMTATTGGPQILAGIPRGMNWFYEKYMNQTRGMPGWDSFAWKTADSPYVDAIWLAQRKAETPERIWRQEYEAEFMTEGGAVFRNVDTCIAPAAKRDDEVVIGLDLARTHDWTVLMAMNSRREWVDHRRVGHVDWSVQRVAVIEMYRRLGASKVVLDATGIQLGAEAVVYDLRNEGLTVEAVHITGEIKKALVQNLMLLFDTSGIRIPMEAAQEFRQFSAEKMDSGSIRYSAPQGKHDDAVMATALAVWGMRHLPPYEPSEIEKTELDRIVERELAQARGDWDERVH